jgi:predicted DNA-binding transcriptional regulator YafY
MTLGNLEEIERWILSWGSHAEVLGPPELKEQIAKTVLSLSDTYRAT